LNTEILKKVLDGDFKTIARLITLIEDENPKAIEIVSQLHKYAGKAHVVGITGPPGVGKSCLISRLIGEYRQRGKTVGVIAVDPTSPFTGGAILGDRIRMCEHTLDKGVFIRSMGSRGSLGGLSRATGNTIKVLDASGKDIIIVETIGIGQTQVDIVKYAHTVVIVLMPKMGDEIQAMKTGFYEIGDIFVVNKADQEDVDKTVMLIEDMLMVEKNRLWDLGKVDLGWEKPVLKTVALTGEGINQLIEKIEEHKEYLVKSGLIEKFKEEKSEAEILDALTTKLQEYVLANIKKTKEFKDLVKKTSKGELDPFSAASQLVRKILRKE
jgi:LAO/AO transport system kinase